MDWGSVSPQEVSFPDRAVDCAAVILEGETSVEKQVPLSSDDLVLESLPRDSVPLWAVTHR